MTHTYMSNEKGFWSLISMLIVLALLGYFAYVIINAYFGPVSSGGKDIVSPGPSGNLATVNPSIVDQTRNDVEKLNQRTFDQLQQVEGLNK